MEKNIRLKNFKLNTSVFAIFAIAIMLLSTIPFAIQANAASTYAQDSVIMGGMPTETGSGVSGALPMALTHP